MKLDELARSRLTRAFYARDARDVAPDLIGCRLVHMRGDGSFAVARIVETEAYRGPTDAACHARFGVTKRTRALFGPPGHAYVFLIYGMYDCFNAVCLDEGQGHAVLVRAAEPVFGFSEGIRGDGPGRLTRALGISRAHDGLDLTTSEVVFVAARTHDVDVATSARIGVGYAGDDADEPWRFYDRASKSVSRPSAKLIGRGVTPPEIRPAEAPQPLARSTSAARRRPSGTSPETRRRDR